MLKENLYCAVTEREVGCGYHYCITAGAYSETAYRTEKGYLNYLERTKLESELIDTYISKEKGKTEIYRLHGKYQEKSFWNMEEIPEGANKFVGLSNGSYVDCYYADVDGIRTIFKPNPNAKEVYKPYNYQSYVWEN
jgi:hypothetical protein